MPHRLGFLFFFLFQFFFNFVIHFPCVEMRLPSASFYERKETGFTKKGAMDWLAEKGNHQEWKNTKKKKKEMNV